MNGMNLRKRKITVIIGIALRNIAAGIVHILTFG